MMLSREQIERLRHKFTVEYDGDDGPATKLDVVAFARAIEQTITAGEKVALLHVAGILTHGGHAPYAATIRQLVQRLAPDARTAKDAANINDAFGHLHADS